MRYAILVLAIAACHGSADRSPREQLAQCLTISAAGADLTRCLIVQKNWLADSALHEGALLQKSIDSIQAELDSAANAQERAAQTGMQLRERAQAERAATSARIDSTFGACVGRALESSRDRATGRYESSTFGAGRLKCQQAWTDARRNAKLPAKPAP